MKIFVKNGIALPLNGEATVTEENRLDVGRAIQEPLYGNEIQEKYKYLPAGMGDRLAEFLTELCFGDFYSRTRYFHSNKNELMALCILAALGQTVPLKAHVKGNIKVGNTMETIYAALLQCLPYIGFPLVFAAINAIQGYDETV